MSGGPRIGRSATVMAAGTAVSRVLGVARATVLVGAVGANAVVANQFALANVLPNVIYMLVAGGVVNAVLVPQVVRAYRTDQGQEYVDRLLTVSLALLAAITVTLTATAPLIVRVVGGTSDPESVALATAFAFWSIPQVFFYGLYTLLGQVLNARGSFGPYMWAPVVNNVVSILGFGLFIVVFGGYRSGSPLLDPGSWTGGPVTLLAGSATLGIVAQALVLLWPLHRIGFRFRPRRDWRGAGLGTAGRVAGWTFGALLAGQVGVLVVTRVSNAAGHLGADAATAGNNAYNLAFTVFMLPHSLVTVSLLTALFTRLSSHAAAGDTAAVRSDTSYGLRTIGVFTVLATAVISVLALPLVRVVLPTATPAEAGSLPPIIVALTAGLTALGAWSLAQRVAYAHEDARSLFWVQVVMAGVVSVGTILGRLVLPVEWWVAGAGASIAASYVLGAIWGGAQVRRRLGGTGRTVLLVHAKAALAALVAAGVVWPLTRLVGDLSRLSFLPAVALSVLGGLAMLAVYAGLLRVLGVRELALVAGPVLTVLRRSMGQAGARLTVAQGPRAQGGDRLDVVIGQGTVLAGRYRLDQPVPTDLPGVECWRAHDQILDRPVRALVLRTERAIQAQDAARRAALVADARLLRVLDVGDHDAVPYVVTEPVTGRDLGQLVAQAPLPADQARAIVGEAAVALEMARRRGVHHLALRPSALHVDAEGRVVVSGLALDGELLGHELGDARSTTRADTVALVALLYTALTGRWPSPPGVADAAVPAAPALTGSPVPPAELVAGVPNDLDTLCSVTLGPHDDGPHSPAELVRELEPWVDLRPVGNADLPSTPGAPGAGRAGAGVAAAAGPSGGARGGSGSGWAPSGGVPGEPAESGRAAPARQSVLGLGPDRPPRPGTPPPAIPPPVRRDDPRRPAAASAPRTELSAAAGGGAGATSGGASGGAGGSPVVEGASTARGTALPPVVPPAGGSGSAHRTTHGSAQGAGHRTAPGRTSGGATAPSVTGAAGQPPRHEPSHHHPRPAAPVDHEAFDTLIGRSSDALTRTRFDPTRLVLALVAIAVVVGLVMAWTALTAPAPPIGGTDGFGDVQDTTPSATATDAAGGGQTGGADGGTDQAAVVPAIAGGQMVDPPPGGDENEHPELAPLAVDGDPATVWYSRTYRSPTYGMKPGIGFAITLAEPATVTTVTLVTRSTGGTVEVRATDPTTPTAGDVLASGPVAATTTLTLSAPTQTQTLVLWFPVLPQTADGSNRIEIAEIQVS